MDGVVWTALLTARAGDVLGDGAVLHRRRPVLGAGRSLPLPHAGVPGGGGAGGAVQREVGGAAAGDQPGARGEARHPLGAALRPGAGLCAGGVLLRPRAGALSPRSQNTESCL
eukprot:3016266-Pyramimonas_sp.AAC.1